ncbi:MAG: aminoacetone oxidase family FAD-binding enzyme [Elusimicrobiota bacterium]|jgi:predicted Rossmann fold flavoprotein|nr:aminoacetone oxidase family FAD-binding enzyme [Elusimicrobiota bacterium]
MPAAADVAIIGAGASGLACGICCARAGKTVVIFEKEIIPARKILITGNGRCNFTNTAAAPDKYFEAAAFAAPALQNFTPKDCIDFFASTGLLYTEEAGGRCFPITGKASSAADCLINAFAAAGGEIKLKTEIVKISGQNNFFKMQTAGGEDFEAAKVVLACGGAAWPQAGGSAKGYDLARRLGHVITPLGFGLSPVNLKEKPALKRLAGLRVYANALLQDAAGKTIDAEEGEVIFGREGVSGNNILSISRNARAGHKLILDWLPRMGAAEFESFMRARLEAMAGLSVKNFLAGILADNAANLLTDFLGVQKNTTAGALKPDIFARIIKTIKAWPFTVEALRGGTEACITRGGVARDGVDGNTMQSKITSGLYITGELLDVDGRCGGYNLHFAWASGVLAAKAINGEK